jgi:hypothetical protein
LNTVLMLHLKIICNTRGTLAFFSDLRKTLKQLVI